MGSWRKLIIPPRKFTVSLKLDKDLNQGTRPGLPSASCLSSEHCSQSSLLGHPSLYILYPSFTSSSRPLGPRMLVSDPATGGQPCSHTLLHAKTGQRTRAPSR